MVIMMYATSTDVCPWPGGFPIFSIFGVQCGKII